MTANQRIALNILATFGRSLYGLVLGLFCGRWALGALGEVDYGLFGVVGGLTAFVAFFNSVLATAVGRFYAFNIARLSVCQQWFTTAVFIHALVPSVLTLFGYPLGVWAIRHYLTIPPERVLDCLRVWQFSCVSGFVAMASVPFVAMYTAKQRIAELTAYSVIIATLNVVFLYYLITHSGIWLVTYAGWTCLVSVLPAIIISVRALCSFPECRFLPHEIANWRRVGELLSFAGWSFFGALGNLLKGEGLLVLVNKMLGPAFNASMSIATAASGQTQTLASAMVGAVMPAITSARGDGNRVRMVSLIFRTCKFGAALVLPFALPLVLEIDAVMVIWLKHPPAQVGLLCVWLLITLVLENMTTGIWVAISANGRIAGYQVIVGTLFILTLPLAAGLMWLGWNLVAVGVALLTTLVLVVLVRVLAAKILLGLSPRRWFFDVFGPIVGVSVTTLAVGCLPTFLMKASLCRVLLTFGLTELVLLPLLWFAVLTEDERLYVGGKLRRALGRESGRDR